jgi:arylsulfatase A-like enzyme
MLLGPLLAAAVAVAAAAEPPRPPRSVILVSIDDLRADRVRPDLMPRLSALAARSVAFRQAVAAATWTLPSHATMLTGLLPGRHGAGGTTAAPRGLRPGTRTLASWLRGRGYATAAFYNGPFLDRAFGLSEGFDRYQHEKLSHVLRSAARWAAAPPSHPFFLFVHSYGVHLYPRLAGGGAAFDPLRPYPVPRAQPSAEDCAAARGRYDDAARAIDRAFGDFLDALERAGALRGAVLAVTSDHGESLCEEHAGSRVIGHAGLPFEEELRVPLLVLAPGEPGRVDDEPVSLADLAPTLIAAAGAPVPAGLDGAARLPPAAADGTGPSGPRAAVAEGEDWASLRTPRAKLIRWTDGRERLYDLEADPAERAPAAGAAPAGWSARLRAVLEGRAARPADAAMPARLREALKASGYAP